MRKCSKHENLIDSPERAAQAVRTIMHYATPVLIAEFMTDLKPNTACCPATAYAQYLMQNAIRHELRERP